MTTLRADLHVHTSHSKKNDTLSFLGARDCYSRPADVYRVAKARGMDLVAITDHDSIDGARELLDHRGDASDVIVGEEVSCCLPGTGLNVHLGVYGMTEALHRDVQALRANVFETAARLREANVFFALNHLLHFYDGRLPLDTYLRLLHVVPALEVRNGTMLPIHNELTEAVAKSWVRQGASAGLSRVGGSDAHSLHRIGTTWTEAPGRDQAEFLSSLQRGLGRPGGRSGSTFVVAGDAYRVIRAYVASLAGFGPPDHRGWRRAACLAFATLSLPFQFIPIAIIAAGKRREREKTVRARAQLVAALEAARPELTRQV